MDGSSRLYPERLRKQISDYSVIMQEENDEYQKIVEALDKHINNSTMQGQTKKAKRYFFNEPRYQGVWRKVDEGK